MYRELQPFREALSQELKASLFPAVAGLDADKLLETYLDRLTMYTGVDVADQTFTALAMDAGKEILGSLEGCANDPNGFQHFVTWARALRDQHGLRIIAIAGETTGIYYWGLWDFLGEQSDIARVLYNPRTTEHMGEVLSKKVRNELVDALLLAEQLRLGSTPDRSGTQAALEFISSGRSGAEIHVAGGIQIHPSCSPTSRCSSGMVQPSTAHR